MTTMAEVEAEARANYGLISPRALYVLAMMDEYRSVLIRFGAGRRVVFARDAKATIEEAEGRGDYCRDVSFVVGDRIFA